MPPGIQAAFGQQVVALACYCVLWPWPLLNLPAHDQANTAHLLRHGLALRVQHQQGEDHGNQEGAAGQPHLQGGKPDNPLSFSRQQACLQH